MPAQIMGAQAMANAGPWDVTPALRQERLEVVARIAVTTRNRAFAEADRAAGDTNWGLACKAHERLMHSLGDVVARGQHPWLGLVREGLYLMPLVEGVPIRVYRGAPDKPSSRHLDAARLEHERWQATAPQMAFDFMAGSTPGASSDGPWYWMMAMETDANGIVTRVVFVQANDAGETRNAWECPLASLAADDVGRARAQVVKLSDKRGKKGKSGAAAASAPPAEPASSPTAPDPRQEGFWGALGAE
jgi:hypothetical protein